MNVSHTHSFWLPNNTIREQFCGYDFSCFILQDFTLRTWIRAGRVLEFKAMNRQEGDQWRLWTGNSTQ